MSSAINQRHTTSEVEAHVMLAVFCHAVLGPQFMFLHMQLRSITGQPGNNCIICRVQLVQTAIQPVGHHLCLTTGAQVSVSKAPKSFYRHHNAFDRYKNSLKETTVVMGGWNQVAGLWGRPTGGHWPQKPTSRIRSIDFDVGWYHGTP